MIGAQVEGINVVDSKQIQSGKYNKSQEAVKGLIMEALGMNYRHYGRNGCGWGLTDHF